MNPLPKRRPRHLDQITGLPTAEPVNRVADRRASVTRPEGVGVWSRLSGGIAAARERGQR
ncbi:hypothetical protein AB0L82_04205 [Nocardia sp. NPDC052001]|uniref:hypothetical protein n=1 Tax=Nocardia sp. NPDC052001 TaxID=3154853 RepID=UPI00341CBEBD